MSWSVVKSGTTKQGEPVELRFAEFGMGSAKLRKWEVFRAGVKVGYASTEGDAETNFARALAGLTRNTETGNWE